MKIFLKVVSITINIILWSILALILALILSLAISGKKEDKMIFGVGFYQVLSGSMQPEIFTGDVIIAKKTTTDDIREGDNLVFKHGDIVVTHKLIEKRADGMLIMHGIANSEGANEIISFDKVIGRQALCIKKLGFALDFLREPFGFILIIALPLVGLIIFHSVSLGKRLKTHGKVTERPEDIKAEIEQLNKQISENNKQIDDNKDNEKK